MLHTVNKSPYANTTLESCLRFVGEGDVILLLEDGVYAAASGTSKSHLIEKALDTHTVYAMQADVKARGVENLIEGVALADYRDFVKLLEKHTSNAWL
ncbi:MAG: sulfurtransferase complex subunit TusB [Gammaproteobacteria bacterium]|nr:MAG: sulfurtransferase complex subunit TusB [Gammaproteobacteria bacterium]